MSEENENVQIHVCHVAILLVLSNCSSSLLLPILPFGLVACTFVLFSDNPSCISYIEISQLHKRRPVVLESRNGNPVLPESFVSRAKALPAKKSERGYGEEKFHTQTCSQGFSLGPG